MCDEILIFCDNNVLYYSICAYIYENIFSLLKTLFLYSIMLLVIRLIILMREVKEGLRNEKKKNMGKYCPSKCVLV